jgi:predicted membrane channel-forming protein YqfA (hemolysin III family)
LSNFNEVVFAGDCDRRSGRYHCTKTQKPHHSVPFFIFLVGAMTCLLTSATCHLLSSYSKAVHTVMIRLDYAGIAALIAASFYPPVYYSFYCTPALSNIYPVSITTIGVAAIIMSLLPFFQKAEFRSRRAALYFWSHSVSTQAPCSLG